MSQDSDVSKTAMIAARVTQDPRLAFLKKVQKRFPKAEWFVVGGAVRDLLMGREPIKDYDLVVRNISLEDLSSVLEELGQVDLVGRNFGVLKFVPDTMAYGEEPLDIAWPRTEQAGMSGGYRDFEIQADPELPIERDLARRDFTVNAIAFDLKKKKLIDPYGGQADLKNRLMRAVGVPAERFQEDYSRMLRGVRLACQLRFDIDPVTWEAMKSLMPHLDDRRAAPDGTEERVVPWETIAKEMVKGLAADPSRCIGLLETSGALFRLIPELAPLSRCGQPTNHHSEGDVWAHTRLALAKLTGPEFAEFFPGEKPTAETAVAVLLHDIAKPQTKAEEGGKMTFYGHAEQGAEIAKAVAERLKLGSVAGGGVDPDRVASLVRSHLFPNMLDALNARKTTLARYFLADRNFGRELLHLAFADAAGSIPADGKPDLDNLRATAAAVADLEKMQGETPGKPPKLISGGDVMELTGIGAGPEVGRLLLDLAEAQLRGEVTTPEQAKEFIKAYKLISL